ncbi:hypothetical protein GCM10010124_23730 [Pilimelia terevasa]|uniref:Uncharacterized protein n=1 Tax=Pilimelia terevasa TaxID=53372 RepID=A0A8J3FHV5_9ACTN|nr:hypothetical protein [Pilimelia terevasa]GGK30249.1 hypothetical protein GCM10010124_23730 [Pilimelia terevasa]
MNLRHAATAVIVAAATTTGALAGAPASAAPQLRPLTAEMLRHSGDACTKNLYIRHNATKKFVVPETSFQGSTKNMLRATQKTTNSRQRFEICLEPVDGDTATKVHGYIRSTAVGQYVRTEPRAKDKLAGMVRAAAPKLGDDTAFVFYFKDEAGLVALQSAHTGKYLGVETRYPRNAQNMVRAARTQQSRELFTIYLID